MLEYSQGISSGKVLVGSLECVVGAKIGCCGSGGGVGIGIGGPKYEQSAGVLIVVLQAGLDTVNWLICAVSRQQGGLAL